MVHVAVHTSSAHDSTACMFVPNGELKEHYKLLYLPCFAGTLACASLQAAFLCL